MRNDIFISYAHEDSNHLDQLRRHLAPYRPKYGVWDDHKIEHGIAWRDEIFGALAQAKVAVLLVSAYFLDSEFIVQEELPAILKRAREGGLKLEWVLVSACAYEATAIAPLQAASDPKTPMDLLDPGKQQAVWTDVAKKIADACETLAAKQNSTPPPVTKGDRKCVLLAQVTDDMEEEAAQVRSYLAQYKDEVALLPTGLYPQGGQAFKSAFERDLAQAGLFVQLLGPRPGRADTELPEGYTRWQFERAKAAAPRVEMMQWRRPDLDTSAISNPTYKEVVTAETAVASGLEAFKRQILDWARKRPHKIHELRNSTVFINADDKDMGVAKEVERECLANALTAILPMTGASSESAREDLTANLVECDVLVFVYGDTTQDWIRSQLRFFNKVRPKREAPPRLLAICSGPPPKPDIGISFPNAHLIKCPDGWNMEQIRSVFAELDQ